MNKQNKKIMNIIKIVMSAAFISLAGISFSQINLGIKAGFNTGNFTLDDEGFEEIISGDNIMGFESGLYLEMWANNLYFRPEALYSYRYGEINRNSANSTLSIHRIELPLMVGVQFLGPLSIEAGPTYHHLVYVDDSFQEDISIRQSAFGYRIGPAFVLGRFRAFANFQGYAFSAGSGTEYAEPYRINAGIGLTFGDK